jgi:hypothetical protein
MGCSGSFQGCSMLGMKLFDSCEQFSSAKVVSLQCGRHSVELRGAAMNVPWDKGEMTKHGWI